MPAYARAWLFILFWGVQVSQALAGVKPKIFRKKTRRPRKTFATHGPHAAFVGPDAAKDEDEEVWPRFGPFPPNPTALSRTHCPETAIIRMS